MRTYGWAVQQDEGQGQGGAARAYTMRMDGRMDDMMRGQNNDVEWVRNVREVFENYGQMTQRNDRMRGKTAQKRADECESGRVMMLSQRSKRREAALRAWRWQAAVGHVEDIGHAVKGTTTSLVSGVLIKPENRKLVGSRVKGKILTEAH